MLGMCQCWLGQHGQCCSLLTCAKDFIKAAGLPVLLEYLIRICLDLVGQLLHESAAPSPLWDWFLGILIIITAP